MIFVLINLLPKQRKKGRQERWSLCYTYLRKLVLVLVFCQSSIPIELPSLLFCPVFVTAAGWVSRNPPEQFYVHRAVHIAHYDNIVVRGDVDSVDFSWLIRVHREVSSRYTVQDAHHHSCLTFSLSVHPGSFVTSDCKSVVGILVRILHTGYIHVEFQWGAFKFIYLFILVRSRCLLHTTEWCWRVKVSVVLLLPYGLRIFSCI